MIKRVIIVSIITVFFHGFSYGQNAEKVIVSDNDPYNLYNFEPVDTSTLFYLKLVPKSKPIGCLVILPSSGELVEAVLKQISLHKYAVEKGLLVVFPSINWGSSKFVEAHQFLDTIFKQVVDQYKIPKDQFVLGGLSGGGMQALRYTEKANSEKSTTYLIPKAVFALDPPLDFAHLYKQAQRDVERNFSEVAVAEGHWLMDMFTKEFGGTPTEVPMEYVNHSIYSHTEKDGGNAKFLLKTPIRIYTEPGIEWQIYNRHRDLYDLNCTDISAMVNLLRSQGNDKAEISVTHDKGIRLDGTKHPHSWSIMNSKECLAWILKQLQ